MSNYHEDIGYRLRYKPGHQRSTLYSWKIHIGLRDSEIPWFSPEKVYG